jgi:pilus assembly protein CpaB
MRACAVKVDEVVGVAGFVTPGMRVDVVTSGAPSGGVSGAPGIMANTILQNIEVLSAGTDIQKDDDGKPKPVKVVNLLVTPEQAETLTLASNHLAIQLVLRNPLDTKINQVPRASLASLLAGEVAPAPSVKPVFRVMRKEAPKAFSIEVVTGSKRSELKVAVPEE